MKVEKYLLIFCLFGCFLAGQLSAQTLSAVNLRQEKKYQSTNLKQSSKVKKLNSPQIRKKKVDALNPATVVAVAEPLQVTPEAHFLAEVRLFAGAFAPRGWLFCEGQILAINDFVALFSLLGTTYGGDGRTNFALPDLRQAEIPFRSNPNRPNSGCRYIISISGRYPSRP